MPVVSVALTTRLPVPPPPPMTPLRATVPALLTVRVSAWRFSAPVRVRVVPETAPMAALLPSVIVPDQVAVVVLVKAPAATVGLLLTPPPLRVSGLATETPATISRVAPLLTTTAADVAPSAAALSTSRMPALTVVCPVYVLVPSSSSVPGPFFTSAPAPLITPVKVLLPVPSSVSVMPLVLTVLLTVSVVVA